MGNVVLLTFMVALSINFQCLVAQENSDPVLDTTGQEVRTGADYYILPASASGDRGGLRLGRGPNTTCPPLVIQTPVSSSDSLPVQFSSVNPNDKTVQVSTDQNIKFSSESRCGGSMVWKLDSQEIEGQFIVTTDGVQGSPGRDTLNSWFNVGRDGDAYKLTFCPTVCDTCRPVCGDLGILNVNGIRILAINRDESQRVIFKNAKIMDIQSHI